MTKRLFRSCLIAIPLLGLTACGGKDEVTVQKRFGFLWLNGDPLVTVPAESQARGTIERMPDGSYRLFLDEANDPGYGLCIQFEPEQPLEDLQKHNGPTNLKLKRAEVRGNMHSSQIPGPAQLPEPGPRRQ